VQKRMITTTEWGPLSNYNEIHRPYNHKSN